MKKLFAFFSILTWSLWPKFYCAAANLKDAFGPNFLDKAAGGDGAGYNTAQRSIDPIIGNVILIVTSFLGVIFLALMIMGGFTWMTAMGDEKKATKAKDMLTAAILGLIIVVAAYMITYFVFKKVVGQSLEVGQ